MGRRYVILGSGERVRACGANTDTRAVLNEIERDSASRTQKKQDKARAPATPSPIAKAIPVAGPKPEAAPAQEPAKGRTAYFF